MSVQDLDLGPALARDSDHVLGATRAVALLAVPPHVVFSKIALPESR